MPPIARTFPGPESDSPPLPAARPGTGAVWVGVYDTTGTPLAMRRAQTTALSGQPFITALLNAAEALGYQAVSTIRTTADDEVEFDVQPSPIS